MTCSSPFVGGFCKATVDEYTFGSKEIIKIKQLFAAIDDLGAKRGVGAFAKYALLCNLLSTFSHSPIISIQENS
jgi:hypothetical protein